jgi:hypothetical protein
MSARSSPVSAATTLSRSRSRMLGFTNFPLNPVQARACTHACSRCAASTDVRGIPSRDEMVNGVSVPLVTTECKPFH